MTKKELKERFFEAFKHTLEHMHPFGFSDSYHLRIKYAVQHMAGKLLTFSSYRSNVELERLYALNACDDGDKSAIREEYGEKNKKLRDVDILKTYLNICKYLDDNKIVYFAHRNGIAFSIIMEDQCIVIDGNDGSNYISFLSETGETPLWLEPCIGYKKHETDPVYHYVVRGSHGFNTRELNINDINVDISLNYNDEMPDKEIKDFLMNEETGIVIMHGEPGTGKSTYIRHLISTIDKTFLYLDPSCFNYLTDSTFLELLFIHKNSIIVLEDAEKILQKRENNKRNDQIAPLLNLTDGLLGDSLKLKVICTFNAKIDEIDPAILRKGRLKIKYEFGKLNENKTDVLLKKLGVDNTDKKAMTLADIYNYTEKVDFDKQNKKSVGFNS